MGGIRTYLISMNLLRKYASRLNIEVTDEQLNSFKSYSDQLIIWNSKFNITRIIDPEEIQIKHFLDSITLCKFIPDPIPQPLSLIDIGSGGGFPGIPLKIMFPSIEITLLEATKKKCDFLSHICKELNLKNTNVIHNRAEKLSHDDNFRNQFDIVTSRAVAPTSTLVEISAGFCKTGGNIIAWKSVNSSNVPDAQRVLQTLTSNPNPGMILEHVVTIPEIQFEQCLLQITKDHDITTTYPRQNGIPKKRPL